MLADRMGGRKMLASIGTIWSACTGLPEVTRIPKILPGGGVTIVEGLAYLDQLTQPRVFFAALPLKLAAGDGWNVRAFAVANIDPRAPDLCVLTASQRIGGTPAAAHAPPHRSTMAFPRLIDLTLPLTSGQRGVSSEPQYTFVRAGWNAAVTAYQQFFNFARKNRSRGNLTPAAILAKRAPHLSPKILLVAPILLDALRVRICLDLPVFCREQADPARTWRGASKQEVKPKTTTIERRVEGSCFKNLD
jgi:hypothetical protein